MAVVMIGVDPHKASHTAVAISSYWRPASGCWMWRPSSARGSGCWGRGGRTRTTRTTPARWPWRSRASGTTVTGIIGVGPVVAAAVIGDVRDISRFASKDHFAAYNGTAPVEVSSGSRVVHRLSLRGDRRMNHAIHMAAVTQIRYRHSRGRAYYDKKIAEGKTSKEALRALKRQVSDALYRRMKADAHRPAASVAAGPCFLPAGPAEAPAEIPARFLPPSGRFPSDRPASQSCPGRIILCTAYDLFALPGQEFGVILSGLDHDGPPGRPDIWSGGVRSQPGAEPGNERPRGSPCPTTRRRPPGGGLP